MALFWATNESYSIILYGIVWYCVELPCILWYCIVVQVIALYRMVLHGIVLYLTVLHGIALLASVCGLYLARHLSTLYFTKGCQKTFAVAQRAQGIDSLI